MGMRIKVSSLSQVGPAAEVMVGHIVDVVRREVDRRAFLTSMELKTASDGVLSGARSGRMYGNHQASAPGEAPAQWSGRLRGSMTPSSSGGGNHWTARLTAGAFYANYLENGTRKMAPRPFRKRILEKAEPEIVKIFSKPYH